jgi:hypothetical protein
MEASPKFPIYFLKVYKMAFKIPILLPTPCLAFASRGHPLAGLLRSLGMEGREMADASQKLSITYSSGLIPPPEVQIVSQRLQEFFNLSSR